MLGLSQVNNDSMYPIFYGFFYLISLIPWPVVYVLSDGVAFLLSTILKYRLDVVHHNLAIAFPNKTIQERNQIAKEFYQKFADTFFETIKLISMTDASFKKRFTSNVEVLNDIYATGQNVQIMAGHFFNWEFANWGAAKYGKYPFIGVYMPLSNRYFDRLILDMRKRYGSILIPATNFKNQFHQYASSGKYAMALAADQNPGNIKAAFWIPFFGKLTPFVKGPEKGAKLNNTAQVFVHFYSTKRGHYHSQYELLTTAPNYFKDGQLTALYVKILEEKIKQHPANYLWSHRRWRYAYDAATYGHLVVK
jgi:KDO2-lipid IV(A) lauroyltransferase